MATEASGTPTSFYTTNLTLLVIGTLVVGIVEHRLAAGRDHARLAAGLALDKDETELGRTVVDRAELNKFKINYLLVYALVMGSDWLQGPYIFSLYHDEFGIDLHTIAILFVLGFLSAGLTAPYVGQWADRYGRKRLCLIFTLAYTLSCCTKMFKPLISLATGRLLGGLATSILFSVFESWLVSSSKSKGMTQGELGELLGRCTLVNGIVASASGVVSDVAVAWSGTYKSPFVASGLLLVAAGLVIRSTWTENYGGAGTTGETGGEQKRPLASSMEVLRSNPSLVVLALAMTVFETSMYLFVFLWVPTLQDSASEFDGPLPLGSIFSAFMVAMMLGSMLYNGLLSRNAHHLNTPSPPTIKLPTLSPPPRSSPFSSSTELAALDPEIDAVEDRKGTPRDPLLNLPVHATDFTTRDPAVPFAPYASPSILFHGKLCAAVLLVAACALGASTYSSGAKTRFYCFLVFEGTVGLYYPILGTLRSAMVPEECRATLSALFRVPLNLLVTLALVTGMESRRVLVFTLSFLMLSMGSVAVMGVIVKRAQGGR